MAGITHSKVSAIEDGADETLIRPSDWNSAHAVASGTSFPTDPAPAEKDLFYRTDEHKFYIYNGSAWVWLGGGGGGMVDHGNEYHTPDFEEEGVAAALVDAHKDLTTGAHGAGANHLALAPAADHLVRSFTKGWPVGKILVGAGVDANPTEIGLPGWELVDDHYFDAPATSYTISSLDGDSAIQYLISVFLVWGSASAGNLYLRPNNDSGDNYLRQYIAANNTTVSAAFNAAVSGFGLGYSTVQYAKYLDPLMTLHAKTGQYRPMFGFRHKLDSTNTTWFSFIQEWQNSADNITSLAFVAEQTNGIYTGSRITVWKRST